ncbi:MAG: N-acetyltransferase, partial [Candidatus Omnitrophica bacterium]|nr:N-acetyltransferase [Candidatus Omnitrophota bacterium]
RFGFKAAEQFGIKAPFECLEGALMVIELKDGALKGVNGVVKYPQPFYDTA